MSVFTIHSTPKMPSCHGPRAQGVFSNFGPKAAPAESCVVDGLELELLPGYITLLTGPSGSGKSAVLKAVQAYHLRACAVHRLSLPSDRPIVEQVHADGELPDALATLTACGLGDARLWLRSFAELSEGERFRARLACCVGRVGRHTRVLVCDEFCNGLHRRAAKAISYNLRKLATRHQLAVVVATAHEDLAQDLQPDAHVRLGTPTAGRFHVDTHEGPPRRRRFSLRKSLIIEQGAKADYTAFKHMHYRGGDELGFVDKVFVIRTRTARDRERCGGRVAASSCLSADARRAAETRELLGIVVYAHPPLELKPRNVATGGRFTGDAARLNREMRIIRRLVIHPDVRGCGLGHWLVRRTLPLVGTPYVECLANMGTVNPVFEKAGMKYVARCAMSGKRARALQDLRALGADPLNPGFAEQVVRRPRVRHIVRQCMYDWYRGMCSAARDRLHQQSLTVLAAGFAGLVASQPVYYLWRRRRRA